MPNKNEGKKLTVNKEDLGEAAGGVSLPAISTRPISRMSGRGPGVASGAPGGDAGGAVPRQPMIPAGFRKKSPLK
jgi:hypothetical protein